MRQERYTLVSVNSELGPNLMIVIHVVRQSIPFLTTLPGQYICSRWEKTSLLLEAGLDTVAGNW